MPTRVVAACALLVVTLATFAAGVLFERWVGTDAVVDWAGLHHALAIRQSRSPGDRSPVVPPKSAAGRTMVALVFGQSNAGNGGETRGTPSRGVFEFYRGQIYDARDPLLGATGDGGSIWLRLGAKAIASGAYDTVILVPFAVGTADVASFAPGGSLHEALLAVVSAARKSGLSFTHLLWEQGEADAIAHTSASSYRGKFDAMLAGIRRLGIDAPIYVARTTRCAKVRSSDEIGDAQGSLVNAAAGVLAGPDLDSLGFGDRYDGCHFSTEGMERAADLWLSAIKASPRAR